MRTLRLSIPSDYLERIAGTAPTDVKAMAVMWLNVYHAPAPRCFAGMSARRTVVTDVSLDNEGLWRSRRLTLVSEIDVTEAPTRRAGCVSSAVATLDYAEGAAGMSTVSLSLNTTFHNPASLGSTLVSVWDLRERHLVATAIFCGLLPSPLKTKAARL
ncbi:hypothetical protein C8F01DRAFT_1253140 [Mycena amicta]|nr:hypothetical protein C8F01DRAFT_1253140 [Mycena amicta]